MALDAYRFSISTRTGPEATSASATLGAEVLEEIAEGRALTREIRKTYGGVGAMTESGFDLGFRCDKF